ncbi:MFS transporter [Streptomonospora alba]|uniref:MFS transporter n=1 Tax=Streptomonospora alba TaxID=183763 RepID=A0A0C2G196_9ACTN|nr:MFS transporter [Streptomonospora alba]KIH97093.1 MFS transporter [Streptomonospora alba]
MATADRTDPVCGAPADSGRPRDWAALAVLVLPVLLISVDMTVLGFAVPYLSADLSPGSAQLLWIVDVYSFVLAGLLVTMGSLGDRIGRRRLLLAGSAGFGAASLLAAYAPTAEVLIAARALLGVAGATLMPSTLSLLRSIFTDERRRLLAVAVWASGFSAGSALGPIVGGWLLERFHWGAIFLINLPVTGLIVLAAPLLVPESRNPGAARLDVPSALLSLGTVLPAVYGIKDLAEHGWSAPAGLAIAAGPVLGAVFVRRQLHLPDPMIDVRLFAVRRFSAAVGTNLMLVFAIASSLFALTQYLQLVEGLSPIRAGLALVPGLVLSVAASFAAVSLSRRRSPATVVVCGLALIAAGFVLTAMVPGRDGALLVAVAFALLGTGMGLAETLTNSVVLTAAPPQRAGAASAISETAYELGGALGVALLGSVLTAIYRHRLGEVAGVPEGAMAEAAETLGAAAAAAEGLGPGAAQALMGAAREAFTDGVRLTGALAAAVVVAAAVFAGSLLRERGSASAERAPRNR